MADNLTDNLNSSTTNSASTAVGEGVILPGAPAAPASTVSVSEPPTSPVTPTAPAPPTPPPVTSEPIDNESEAAPAAAPTGSDNAATSPLVRTRRSKAASSLQEAVVENPTVAEDLRYHQQSLVRYQMVVNQQQAEQYIQDLELFGLNNIADNREKALHLFGFYEFLHQQKESELFVDNLLKTFQLAVFYDDNYVYRYYLAWYYFLRGDRESAHAHIQDVVNKIKNKQVTLYSSLAQAINVQVLKNQINDLLIKLALPTLDDTLAF